MNILLIIVVLECKILKLKSETILALKSYYFNIFLDLNLLKPSEID